jgi:hypothetical protein
VVRFLEGRCAHLRDTRRRRGVTEVSSAAIPASVSRSTWSRDTSATRVRGHLPPSAAGRAIGSRKARNVQLGRGRFGFRRRRRRGPACAAACSNATYLPGRNVSRSPSPLIRCIALGTTSRMRAIWPVRSGRCRSRAEARAPASLCFEGVPRVLVVAPRRRREHRAFARCGRIEVAHTHRVNSTREEP